MNSNQGKVMKYLVVTFLVLLVSNFSYAGSLSNKAVFYKCYGQITQSHPDPNSTIVKQVEAGQIDPIQACINTLNKAVFTANGNNRIANTSDQEALKVLKTLHQLHYSFLENKHFNHLESFNNPADNVDPNGPSLHFTKALFTPNYKFSDIFKNNTIYESDRATNSPTKGPYSKRDLAYFNTNQKTGYTFKWIEEGDLYGIKLLTSKSISYAATGNTPRDPGTIKLDYNWGGGIIGSFNYVLMNLHEPRSFRADANSRMPRKWIRSVLKDFMCRSLPVIRYADAAPHVSNTSNIGYRTDAACVRCHASMDRMSAVIRSVKSVLRLSNSSGAGRFSTVEKWVSTPSRTAETKWPDATDSDYYRRPENGTFYYRTFDGTLVDQKVSGAAGLAQVMSELDDPYVCMAKKYYQYFTGIEANIDDIGDPQYGRKLSALELEKRNEVIALGRSFKSHQNLKRLLEDILKTPQFKFTGR